MKGERLLWILLVAAGIGAGYRLGLPSQASPPPASQIRLDSPQTKAGKVEAGNQPPVDQSVSNAPIAPAVPAPAPTRGPGFTPIEKLQVLSELQQRKLVRPSIPTLDRKGQISDAFAELFALKPDERARLQQSLDGAREKLAALERANATVTRDASGRIVVAVQPFPGEGGKIYDEIMQGFADVLGPERNDAYRVIGAEQVENSLNGFGAAEHTYTFGYETGDRPGQSYTLRDEVVQRTANGRTSHSSNNRFQSYDDLAAHVGPIISVLPPEFKKDR
ncbi:MAG TPA: hypothetical protein VG734_12640 [Lacunisphaera sp.]|nr:hypothetical protein [Lacunisphaera sp.]